jgi:hypothetical protein
MAKEKADSDKRGWFARWRERRAHSKQRTSEITNRMYEERHSRGGERHRPTPPGGPASPGGGGG